LAQAVLAQEVVDGSSCCYSDLVQRFSLSLVISA